ncbi:uncharacterized protein LOC131948952 [Physella acuta]|uniref:uncharacterized protein LOC131948952 n=1 Tax=Physella acuta TaxID=109671 RepID=UPI0027DB5607|nr:uncharacterized protein LOC131948952 [Physella acuta]
MCAQLLVNPSHEANQDQTHEIRIIPPESEDMITICIAISDVNGDDINVREVKTEIFRKEKILNPDAFTMVAINKRKTEREMDENASILDYFEEMSNGHFKFRLKA